MKNMFFVFLLSMLLVGCDTFVKPLPEFPPVPPVLLQSCYPLLLTPEKTDKLSEVVLIVTENYALYHECAVKNEGWIGWYEAQKEIYNSLRNSQ